MINRWRAQARMYFFVAAALSIALLVSPARALDVELQGTVGAKGDKAGQFKSPTGVIVDREGNIHVVDSGNGRIQVFGGRGNYVSTYGNANVRHKLEEPWDIAQGPDGNFYVTDRAAGRVVVFAPNGSEVRVIGDKGSRPGELSGPKGIDVDSQGRVYVADTGSRRVSAFTSTGIFLFAVDAAWDKKAEFSEPVDVAVDPQDSVYIVDNDKAMVVVLDRRGKFDRQILGRSVGFREPSAIAVDQSGTIAVLDSDNQRVIHVSPELAQLAPFGTRGTQPGQFDDASGIAFDDKEGRFLVADTDNNRLQIFRIRKREFDKPLSPLPPQLEVRYVTTLASKAEGVSIGDEGEIFVTIPGEGKVQMLDEKGNVRLDLNEPKGAPGYLRKPQALHYGEQLLYVADHGDGAIKVFNTKGVFQFKFGESGSDPGEFSNPLALDVYKGDIYLSLIHI